MKIIFFLLFFFTVSSCTSDSIQNNNYDKNANSNVPNYSNKESNLEFFITIWEKLDSSKKRESAYQTLLRLEASANTEFENKNYFDAWNKYSIASIYYPSPRLSVKAGDALILQYITHDFMLCDCDPDSLGVSDSLRYKIIELDYLKHKISRNYSLALDFNRYPKNNYNHEQSLNHDEEMQLEAKIECLIEKTNFEADLVDASVMLPCLELNNKILNQ